uniref:Uncharacterized protein n=1 Tax=Arundo donax TaxID=35708 RepID=A0A0A8ZEX7_ARUDO
MRIVKPKGHFPVLGIKELGKPTQKTRNLRRMMMIRGRIGKRKQGIDGMVLVVSSEKKEGSATQRKQGSASLLLWPCPTSRLTYSISLSLYSMLCY